MAQDTTNRGGKKAIGSVIRAPLQTEIPDFVTGVFIITEGEKCHEHDNMKIVYVDINVARFLYSGECLGIVAHSCYFGRNGNSLCFQINVIHWKLAAIEPLKNFHQVPGILLIKTQKCEVNLPFPKTFQARDFKQSRNLKILDCRSKTNFSCISNKDSKSSF